LSVGTPDDGFRRPQHLPPGRINGRAHVIHLPDHDLQRLVVSDIQAVLFRPLFSVGRSPAGAFCQPEFGMILVHADLRIEPRFRLGPANC
jgi:hypothetical protein